MELKTLEDILEERGIYEECVECVHFKVCMEYLDNFDVLIKEHREEECLFFEKDSVAEISKRKRRIMNDYYLLQKVLSRQ